MPAQFVYGRRNGNLVHVKELRVHSDRGRQCGCECPICGRSLQAHMGETKSWHFQHDVDNRNCNPQPMTLLHAFVRDKLAEKRELWLPGGPVEVSVEMHGRVWWDRIELPDTVYKFEDASPEMNFGSMQPDVVYSTYTQPNFALEVRKTHAVDAVKQALMEKVFTHAVEFDVSDLCADGLTSEELEVELRDRHRWRWLHRAEYKHAESRLRDHIRWDHMDWDREVEYFAKVQAYKPAATAKLREAQKRLPWAKAEFARMKRLKLTKMEKASFLGQLSLTDRVAVVCAAIGVEPNDLPVHFAQRVNKSLEHHPYSWQLPVFAAWGLGARNFTSREVEDWALAALPECVHEHQEERSKGGFTKTRAALHNFLVQLELQGLLRSDRNERHGQRLFRPAFANWSEYTASKRQNADIL